MLHQLKEARYLEEEEEEKEEQEDEAKMKENNKTQSEKVFNQALTQTDGAGSPRLAAAIKRCMQFKERETKVQKLHHSPPAPAPAPAVAPPPAPAPTLAPAPIPAKAQDPGPQGPPSECVKCGCPLRQGTYEHCKICHSYLHSGCMAVNSQAKCAFFLFFFLPLRLY